MNNPLKLSDRRELINAFAGIALDPLTPKDTIDKLIKLVKNEAERLNIHYVVELIKTINSNAKDSNHE